MLLAAKIGTLIAEHEKAIQSIRRRADREMREREATIERLRTLLPDITPDLERTVDRLKELDVFGGY